jgi:DnaJ-class molecular chaperone
MFLLSPRLRIFLMDVNDLETCPRCRGSGADPDQPAIPNRLPDDPVSGERGFQASADLCRRCGGSGRVLKNNVKPSG